MEPAPPAPARRADRPCPELIERVCLAAAFALTLAWFLAFDHFRPDYLVDEAGHLGNIYHLLEGKPGWPEQMTMLPGYHAVVAALWQLHPPLRLLTLARLVATVSALVALAAFAGAWKKLHGGAAGPPTLLLALLPILQPFTALAYTDVPALALILTALAAHFSGRRALAALALAAAALVRQTTLVWAAFLLAHETLAHLSPPAPQQRCNLLGYTPGPANGRDFLRRIGWLALLLALAGLAVGLALVFVGRLTPGTQTGNSLRPNPATLHFAGLLALLLGLPVWLAHAPAALRAWRGAFAARHGRTLALTALALAAAVALAFAFRNPHVWNREFFWDNGKFTLLRNWPLIYLDTHPWLRALSGLNLALMAAALAFAFARQPRRRELWLALACGALLPFANNLVEPRYFIDAAVLVLLLLELAPADTRRLAAWWFVLCAAHAPFIARGVSLW